MNITNTKSNTVLTGSTSADSIQNYSGPTNVTINALGGDDTIKNWGDFVSINAGAGNDTIYSDGKKVTILGGSGSDSVTNWGSSTSILGGDGNDSIANWQQGTNVSIAGGNGNDFIVNDADSVTVVGNAGSDTIRNQATDSYINGGADNDSIYNDAEKVTILGGSGSDSVTNWGASTSILGGLGDDSIGNGQQGTNVSIAGDDGNDFIVNDAASVTVAGDTGADTVVNKSYNVSINGGSDNDSIQNTGHFVTLSATSGNNFFANFAEYVTVAGGTDSDTVHNQSANVSINTGTGNDSVQNSGATVKILLGDGSDEINNFGSNSTISGGDGNDSIGNWADTENVSLWSGTSSDNVSISGGAGNDSIYNNGGNNVTLGGDDGNDTIKNFYATVKIDGGNDNDSIYNDATNVTINGGAGSDTVNNGSENVSINGYTGDDSIINEGANVTILGGDGSDTITNKTVVYATINGKTITVRPDNVSINGGAGNDSIINTSGESFWLGGGKAVSMGGGTGNDTLTGSTAGEIFVYESGNDVITNYSGEDTVKIASGSIDSYYTADTDLIFNIGTGSLTLKNMQGRYVTITDAAGKTTTQLYGSTGYTAQDAIKNLVQAWNKTFLSSTAKLDESIKLSTHFNTIQDAIDQMVADCAAAGDADTFLRKYCGIILDNADTGAITGWDAGSDSIKTTDNVMGETLSSLQQVPDYTDTTFTARNLTINIKSTGSSLNADGKKTFDGLYSWWAEEAVKLIEDSYGFSFSDGDSIRVEMVPSASYAGNTSSSGIVKLNQGNISYDSDDDYNGNGMDRTIAHEFTHVAQNYFMGHFAQFLEEGLADLTPGIEDRGGKSEWIESLAANSDSLATYLNLDNDGTGETPYYVAGYMFYRYLARQAAFNFDSSADYAWKDGILLSGTSDADLLTGSGSNSTLTAGAGSDTVTAYGESMNVLGEDGNDRIYNAGSNSTIAGGAGNDSITNTGENVLFNYADGDGNDSITGFDETSTLSIAADNFSTAKSSGNIIVTIGDGKVTLRNAASLSTLNIVLAQDDSTYQAFTDNDATKVTLDADIIVGDATARTTAIKLVGNALDNSLLGGSGKDSLYGKDGDDYLAGGAGNDKLFGQNGDDTLLGGTGNDTLKGGDGADVFIYTAGNDVITDYALGDKISIGGAITKSSVQGSDATFTIGSNTLTVKNGKGQELAFIDADGTERTIIGGAYLATDSSNAKATLAAWREVGDASARTKAIKLVGNALDNSIFGGSGKDSLYGNDGDDYLAGNAGNDKLFGQNGDDSLWGGTGNDTLTGGDGADTFIYTAGSDVIEDYEVGDKISISAAISKSSIKDSDVTFTIGSNTLTVKNGKGQELAFIDADGNERTIIGGAYLATDSSNSKATLAAWREVGDATARTTAIKLVGNALDNSLLGGSGKDSLYGNDGDDYLAGNAGNDKLFGQNGDDSLWGGTGNDTLTGGDGADTFIYTAGSDVIEDYEVGDKISISAAIAKSSIKGSDATFTIGSNTLTVKNGKGQELAFIDADGNERTIIGGAYLATDSSNAKATLASWREVGDASARTKAIKLVGNALDNSIFGGSGKDSLYGNDGDDYLAGNAGNDKLFGQNGDDTLWGGTGNDTLKGGDGADTFIYTAGKDVIADFADDDLLQISETFTGTYNESANTIAFKVGSTANAITLKNFTASTFNINGDAWRISGSKLVK